jgi:phenylalanyl-tRNA synthetase beta chain
VDFFDVKGVAERICAAFGVAVEFTESERSFLVRGRTAEAHGTRDGQRAAFAIAGQLLPSIADARGFPAAEELFVAELDLAALFSLAAGDDLRAESLPRHPAIVRDVSILVPDRLPASTVRGTIRSSAPPTLVSIVEFDRYTGKGVPAERVSLSLRLTFRAPDRTLTDDEVQAAMDTILAALKHELGAEQR